MESIRNGMVCVVCAQVLILTFAACQSGEGWNRLSEPSSSAAAAKALGVFLKPVTAVVHEVGPASEQLRLDEVWLEEVIERFKSIPIRRKVSGTRLCIRLALTRKQRPPGGIDAQIKAQDQAMGAPARDATVFTRDAILVSFKVDGGRWFPKVGKVTITEPSTHEKVVVGFSVVE